MGKLKIFFITLLFSTLLYGENYSEMSTQELISIMGYVDKSNIKKFEVELSSRVSTMTKEEKKMYQKNLKKLKNEK